MTDHSPLLDFLDAEIQEQSVTATDTATDGPAVPAQLLLSAVLGDIPPLERSRIIEKFEYAVRKGHIQAVPLDQPSFSVVIPRAGRKLTRRALQDYSLLDTPALHGWLKAMRSEARCAHMQATGKVSSTVERLTSGEDSFLRLAELYRQTLLTQRRADRGR